LTADLIRNETGHTRERLLYIDNLRLLVIVLVVTIHLAVTISGFGNWYYTEGTHLDTLSTIWFAFYQSFTQGYFLGLLFMISGYFIAGSYDHKGFGGFVGDRFKRLIVPTLIYMIAITPFIEIVELGQKPTGFDLVGFLSGTGVMWFAATLFGFSLIYGLVRLVSRKSIAASNVTSGKKHLEPTLGMAVSLILIIAVCAFLIRIVQPIGTDILNFQLCYFASYIVLFIVGILAYRNNLFAKISYRAGKRLVIGAIALGFLAWFVLVAVATATGSTVALEGGMTWQSAAFSTWESFIAVAMSIGLIAVFREKFNRQSKLVKTLSDNSFAVYMFHPIIIIPVTLLLTPLAFYPIAKWLLLCVICAPLCFAATHFVFRKIPLLKNVL
jgi:glucan biosynthesis protein C